MKDKNNPIYPFEAAVARIEATAAAADAFGFAFHLTGRCELLAGECGSGRYNPPIESLRRCGRKGSYRTRTSRPRGGEDHLQRAFHTVQFHGGYSGPVLRYRVTASVRRPAYQFGDGDLSKRHASGCRCGDGSPRPRHIRICRNGFALAGPGRIHEIARVTTLLLFFLQAGHQLDEIAGSKPAVQLVM